MGLSLILRNGGCIDGSEIFANIIVKKIYNHSGKDYSISYILIAFNACVYGAVFVLLDRDSALLSLDVYKRQAGIRAEEIDALYDWEENVGIPETGNHLRICLLYTSTPW